MFNEQDGEMLDYYDLTTERGKRNRKRIQKMKKKEINKNIWIKRNNDSRYNNSKRFGNGNEKTSGDVIKNC